MHNEIVPPGLAKYRRARALGKFRAIKKKITSDLILANPDLAKPERAVLLKNLVSLRLSVALKAI